MKKLLLLLGVLVAFNFSFAIEQNNHFNANEHKTFVQKVEKISPFKIFKANDQKDNKAVVLGRYAMLGITLFLIGVLILILPPEVIKIVAYTLIVTGVVFFVLDVAKII